MRTRFLFPIIPLFIIGAILFGGSTTIAEVGLFIVKAAFILLAFGFFFGMMKGGRPNGRPGWHHRRQPSEEADEAPAPDRPSAEDRFEEWHRLAHAREEVDGWVDDTD